mmetsp:Transcript_13337/g.44523  ORF Transcript_13337/g.44523 Transcript_13337/m.44523 type:complete len:422 (-) Transcript_13337:911-2176(-)
MPPPSLNRSDTTFAMEAAAETLLHPAALVAASFAPCARLAVSTATSLVCSTASRVFDMSPTSLDMRPTPILSRACSSAKSTTREQAALTAIMPIVLPAELAIERTIEPPSLPDLLACSTSASTAFCWHSFIWISRSFISSTCVRKDCSSLFTSSSPSRSRSARVVTVPVRPDAGTLAGAVGSERAGADTMDGIVTPAVFSPSAGAVALRSAMRCMRSALACCSTKLAARWLRTSEMDGCSRNTLSFPKRNGASVSSPMAMNSFAAASYACVIACTCSKVGTSDSSIARRCALRPSMSGASLSLCMGLTTGSSICGGGADSPAGAGTLATWGWEDDAPPKNEGSARRQDSPPSKTLPIASVEAHMPEAIATPAAAPAGPPTENPRTPPMTALPLAPATLPYPSWPDISRPACATSGTKATPL